MQYPNAGIESDELEIVACATAIRALFLATEALTGSNSYAWPLLQKVCGCK
jgi:hypothetical protein